MSKKFFNSKKVRYGINATVITALFIVAVILVNMIAGLIVDKFPGMNIDLSENGQFKISKATKDVLKNLDAEIKMTVVLYGENEDVFVNELLDRYKGIDNKISYTYVDPLKNPTAIKKYGNIDPRGSLIIECGDKFQAVSFPDLYGVKGRMEDAESLITNAIVFVTSENDRRILVTEGHGEEVFATLIKTAENKYFKVEPLDLRKNDIENCDILAICAPKNDFTQQELSLIDKYVNKGGNLQIYLSPEAPYLNNLYEYIKEWGIEIKNETVKESSKDNIYTAGSGFLPEVAENDFTKGIDKNILYDSALRLDILFSNTRGITVSPMLTTTKEATTVANANDTGKKDRYNIALMSVKDLENGGKSKLFLSGSSLLFTRDYSSQFVGNASIATVVMKNMLSSKDFVEIETKKTNAKPMKVTLSDLILVIIVIFIIAIGILVLGIVIWSKRRYL